MAVEPRPWPSSERPVIRAHPHHVRKGEGPRPDIDKESTRVNERITRRRAAGVASMAALLLAIAVPASAHVFIVESDVVGGGDGTETTLRVPHGCDGAATDTLEVKTPPVSPASSRS